MDIKFNLITLFPEIYDALDHGLIGKAIQNNVIELNKIHLRDFAINKHGQIDGKPFGGEKGMIMMVEPLENALKSLSAKKKHIVINFSPQGKQLDQSLAKKMLDYDEITIVNGRYEGIDQRFIDKYVDLEVSLGDYVFSNGDLASLVLIDVLARMIPSVIGKEESVTEDSFFNGLLKGPTYTRPEVYDGMSVPEILLSGNHEEIKAWREYQSIKTTLEKRPEIFDKIKLTKKQKKLLEELDSKRIL